MKYLIILIALFITSCSNELGIETVKVSNTLSVVTTPLANFKYPKYKAGDSVIIWRANESSNWHIETLNDNVYNNNLFTSYKGVIVK